MSEKVFCILGEKNNNINLGNTSTQDRTRKIERNTGD